MVTFVDSPSKLASCIEQLRAVEAIAIDTEFVRESTFFPKLALVQCATVDSVWLLDPLAFSREQLDPFLTLLQDPQKLKILHAAYADQEVFYVAYGFVLSPVLDTSVAAALLGMGENIGLAKVVKEVLGADVKKGQARVHWLERPLAPSLLEYAANDVRYLPLLCQRLRGILEKKKRWEWALVASQGTHEAFERSAREWLEKLDPSRSLASDSAAVLLELLEWRENEIRRRDIPRSWLIDNDTLVAIARVLPKRQEELMRFRGIKKGRAQDAAQIIACIQRGLSRREQLKRPARVVVDTEIPAGTQHLVQSCLRVLAERYEVAPSYLIPSDKLSQLVRRRHEGPSAWVDAHLLNPWAASLIGPELHAFLRGEFALGLQEQNPLPYFIRLEKEAENNSPHSKEGDKVP